MADIVGAKVKMNDVETAVDAALTEALHTKIGANINALIDADTSHDADFVAVYAAIAANDDKVRNRGTNSTTASYSVSEPVGDTLIATLSVNVKGNTIRNVLLRTLFQLNLGKSGASATYRVVTSTAGTYRTRFRITRQIGAGSEVEIINESQNVTIGTPGFDSGVQQGFLGAHRYLNNQHLYDTFACTSDQTVTYRLYIDFDAVSGSFTGSSFTGGGIDVVTVQEL